MKTHISSPVSEGSLVCGWYIYRPQSLVSVQLSELQLHSGHCWWPTVLTLKPTDPDREVTGWTLEMFRPVSQSFSLFRYCLQNVVVLVLVRGLFSTCPCTFEVLVCCVYLWPAVLWNILLAGDARKRLCLFFSFSSEWNVASDSLCVCVCLTEWHDMSPLLWSLVWTQHHTLSLSSHCPLLWFTLVTAQD